jgi:hypothetical protein
MLYRLLLQNEWSRITRSIRSQHRWLVGIAITLVLLYLTFVLVVSGYFFRDIFHRILIRQSFFGGITTRGPVFFLNQYLIELFLGLFGMRFFIQLAPRMKPHMYLLLPIPRAKLVRFFQFFSLLSLHNVVPFLFFIPFWLRNIWFGGYPVLGALSWIAGIALIILLSHFTNNWLRVVLSGNTVRFILIVSGLSVLVVLDNLIDTRVFLDASSEVFGALLMGDLGVVGILAGMTVGMFLYSCRRMERNLHHQPDIRRRSRSAGPAVFFAPERGQVLNLILLELKMMWRNKRPKHYFLLSAVFATAYIALMLAGRDIFFFSALTALFGLFASGTFALNYGQLMFAWESSYFDGLMARNIRPEELVVAKLMVLQGSCLVFFLLSLPLFIWLGSNLLLLHVAFLFYNAGVTSVLMLALAVRNRKRVNISKSGGFFNYEGFSAMHWMWILPTVIPPAVILFLLQSTQWTALLTIGGIGVASLVLSRQWSELFTRHLVERKHLMGRVSRCER